MRCRGTRYESELIDCLTATAYVAQGLLKLLRKLR
jgi:hypothetical protein